MEQDDPKIEGWYKKITNIPSSLRPWKVRKDGDDGIRKVGGREHE